MPGPRAGGGSSGTSRRPRPDPFGTDSEIDRFFRAHGRTLPSDANTNSKTTLVDAYCARFDWNDLSDAECFREIVNNVLSTAIAIAEEKPQAAAAIATFVKVCTRHGVSIEDGAIATSGHAPQKSVDDQRSRSSEQRPRFRKVLFLASNPVGTKRLRLDQEVRDISEGLKRSNERERFELITLVAAGILELRRGLLDHSPQIVHFAGHGEDDGILLEGVQGKAVPVPVDALADLFRLCRGHIECVILNACHSDVQAAAIAEHIPCVIGMNAGVSDKAAIEFAVGLYDALGAGKSIEEAFEFGRNAIALMSIPEDLTPVLIKTP